MKPMTATIKLTMILLSSVQGAGSAKLSFLQSYYFPDNDTVTSWATLMIEDMEIFTVYNDTPPMELKQSWVKGSLEEFDWLFYDMSVARYFHEILMYREIIVTEVKYTFPATLQFQSGGVAYAEDPESYYFKVAVNGEDVVYLNLTEFVWVAQNSPYSQAVKEFMNEVIPRKLYNYYLNIGKKMCRIFALAGKEALSKKSKPEVYFIMNSSNPEPELECLVTGFYPRSVNITLWKDNENMMDNVMVSETLPNGDGTYQERAIVTRGWEEQTTVYCKVEHISLEEPLVRQLNMRHNAVTWIVIGAILGVVICVTGLIWFVRKKPS
ncbi:antigen-presenting glycoprotein CD1d-like [Leptodactylus fuscus]|uniref:antigen-presenting glycoprotein CD1d-like n=1 Tax=Leptodactylus fuscus TaxID=238119 RepID=UPI003F4F029D